MPNKVISEGKEVTFSSKAYKIDKTNKVGMDKLILVFCSLLRFICDFYLLTTIADNLIRFIYEVDVKTLNVLFEYLKVEISQLFIPGYKSFLCY